MNDEAVRIVLFEPASPSEIPTSQVILQSLVVTIHSFPRRQSGNLYVRLW